MERETLVDNIKEVTDLLYQQKLKEGYQRLNLVLADISAYVATIEDETKQQEILETLTESLDAMQQQDTTLLADILQYELLERL
jgi:hypothetical protein